MGVKVLVVFYNILEYWYTMTLHVPRQWSTTIVGTLPSLPQPCGWLQTTNISPGSMHHITEAISIT